MTPDASELPPDLPALAAYGWDGRAAAAFEPFAEQGFIPGRVIAMQRGSWRVVTDAGEGEAVLQRALRSGGEDDHPAVGDWLALSDGAGADRRWPVRAVVPRRSAFRRAGQAGGRYTGTEVLAANVDVIFIVSSLNADLNERRLERYVTLAWASGAEPVVILNKADLAADPAGALAAVASQLPGAAVHAVSARTGTGLDALQAYLSAGRTIALLGSSGVGKSTLVNALLGRARQVTREIREDDARGRHTTTSRELIPLPGGAVLVDTPGLRAVGLTDDKDGLAETFSDILDLALRCRFRDCSHRTEPGCAVLAALANGSLDAARFASYLKLEREVRALERRASPDGRADARRFSRMIRAAGKTSRRALYEQDR